MATVRGQSILDVWAQAAAVVRLDLDLDSADDPG
jgi:hypothetical protein